jgi:hypothetical protein
MLHQNRDFSMIENDSSRNDGGGKK